MLPPSDIAVVQYCSTIMLFAPEAVTIHTELDSKAAKHRQLPI